MARAGPVWGRKLGASLGSSMWLQTSKYLGCALLLSQATSKKAEQSWGIWGLNWYPRGMPKSPNIYIFSNSSGWRLHFFTFSPKQNSFNNTNDQLIKKKKGLFAYLIGSITQRGRDIFYLLAHYASGQNKWGCARPKPGAKIIMWGPGSQTPGSSSTASPSALTGSWTASGTAESPTGTHMGWQHHRHWFHPL